MILSRPGARIFVVAAESSGDMLGQHIMKGLSDRFPSLVYEGVGGPLMESQGHFSSMISLSSLSCMGIFSVAKKLPFLLKSLSKVRYRIRHMQPTALLTIDAPDFSLRISQSIAGMPRIHCVAPSVWAWRPGRAKTMVKKTDHLLTLFPFESRYFQHMRSTWVGHPVAEQPLGCANRFWSCYGEREPLVCLLPGSRQSEVDRCLPIFLEAVKRLRHQRPNLKVVMVCPPHLRFYIERLCDSVLIVSNEKEKRDVFAATTLAIAASGTVTLELARQGVSMVVGYRLSALSAWIARSMIKISHVCLLNILSDKPFVPECIQDDFCPESICYHAAILLDAEKARTQQIRQSQQVIHRIKGHPSSFGANAARAIETEIAHFYG
jgi:lipid-A-disaccharide synthase